MRFIFNFIFFGILFYIIWLYFPDAFKTLVDWASNTVAFLKNLVQTAMEKVHETQIPPPAPPDPTPTSSLLIPFLFSWRP